MAGHSRIDDAFDAFVKTAFPEDAPDVVLGGVQLPATGRVASGLSSARPMPRAGSLSGLPQPGSEAEAHDLRSLSGPSDYPGHQAAWLPPAGGLLARAAVSIEPGSIRPHGLLHPLHFVPPGMASALPGFAPMQMPLPTPQHASSSPSHSDAEEAHNQRPMTTQVGRPASRATPQRAGQLGITPSTCTPNALPQRSRRRRTARRSGASA